MGEQLIEKDLRGLLCSLHEGPRLDSFSQALLVGPIRDIRPVAIWIVSVNQGLSLRVLGSADLRGKDVQLSMDATALQEFFIATVLGLSSSERFNRGSIDLPLGLNCGASLYSVLPVQDRTLPRGFLFVSHQERWSWQLFGDGFFEAIEAITLHAIETVERARWKSHAGASVVSRLSERQLSILQRMSAGLTNYQIGHLINVSESTVKQECIRIFRFLNVRTRKEAVDQALRLGILRTSPGLETDTKNHD